MFTELFRDVGFYHFCCSAPSSLVPEAYYNIYSFLVVLFIENVYTKFRLDSVLTILVMYGMRLFVVLQCLLNCLHVIFIRGVGYHHFTIFFALNLPVSEIVHILPVVYYNVYLWLKNLCYSVTEPLF